ncbi:hypothetical protein PSPTOT1_4065 [Pseudomonas syringae pv. tomato T1]|nr:hypothetical protein PSPTOT1_4065 [Pseudomonas syringae pv. tomato T1]
MSDDTTIRSGQPGLFFFLTAGDHETGNDFHLAKNITFVFVLIGLGTQVLVKAIKVVCVQGLDLTRGIHQANRISERSQANPGVRGELDPVD